MIYQAFHIHFQKNLTTVTSLLFHWEKQAKISSNQLNQFQEELTICPLDGFSQGWCSRKPLPLELQGLSADNSHRFHGKIQQLFEDYYFVLCFHLKIQHIDMFLPQTWINGANFPIYYEESNKDFILKCFWNMVTQWTKKAISLEAGFQSKESLFNKANRFGVTPRTHTCTGFK